MLANVLLLLLIQGWVGYFPVGESDRVSNDVLPVDYTHGLRDSGE